MSSVANSAGHETGRGPDNPEKDSGATPAWIHNGFRLGLDRRCPLALAI